MFNFLNVIWKNEMFDENIWTQILAFSKEIIKELFFKLHDVQNIFKFVLLF